MSVDVDIGTESFNYTNNVSRLWHDHLRSEDGEVTGFMALDGLTGAKSFRLMKDAFVRINDTRIGYFSPCMSPNHDVGDREFCAKYDAPNGWGSTVGGLIFMAQVMAACAANPRKRVEVSV